MSGANETEMTPVFAKTTSEEVDEVLDGGGRVDDWKKCLEPGARFGHLVPSDSVAFSTCVEFPPNAGVDGATLLAVQRWVRDDDDDNGEGGWKLALHQTIPWSAGSRAGGTLRCDCRGCVALARAQDRRTFGGLIG